MRRLTVIAAILAFGLLAAACSGSDADSGVASLETAPEVAQDQEPAPDEAAAEEPASDEEAILAFAACLRDEGLDVEDPTVDADGNLRPPRPRDIEELDRDMMRSAMETCSEYLENVAFGLDGEDQTERQDQLLEYAACMRDNGYDMPDPDFSTMGNPGQGGGGPFGALDRDDPAFQTAQEACADIFGADGRVPGAGPGGGERG
ncbi:MAG: hypothetical protein WCC01_04845 [Acidimicrobiia bacterium]